MGGPTDGIQPRSTNNALKSKDNNSYLVHCHDNMNTAADYLIKHTCDYATLIAPTSYSKNILNFQVSRPCATPSIAVFQRLPRRVLTGGEHAAAGQGSPFKPHPLKNEKHCDHPVTQKHSLAITSPTSNININLGLHSNGNC